MLKQRLFTATILIACFLGALFLLPAPGFEVLVAAVLVLGAWEWARLAGVESNSIRSVMALAMSMLLYLVMHLPPNAGMLLIVLGACWWLLATVLILLYPAGSDFWGRRGPLLCAGLPVLLPGWAALIHLGMQDTYRGHILFCVALVAVADSGAYFSGKLFGKRKLAPIVSPKKTLEGLAGGMLAAALLGAGAWSVAGMADIVSLPAVLAGSVLLALVSVVGDLFESMVKRQRGIKDSGNILPGHGGVLDRLDSITAALPVYVLMLSAAESL